jgi:hypothetical protein
MCARSAAVQLSAGLMARLRGAMSCSLSAGALARFAKPVTTRLGLVVFVPQVFWSCEAAQFLVKGPS